jgi:mevalonate kinase
MAYAHGKVILFGEHSVVYGHPALAKAIERAAVVTARPSRTPFTTLHVAPWNVQVDTSEDSNVGREPLQAALKLVRALYQDGVELELSAEMSIPPSAGMGSSAALGVAVLRALDEARALSRPDAEIFERSFLWESVFHDRPGGVDNAMATYGGVAVYTKGSGLQQLAAAGPPHLIAVDSGGRPPTKEMVALVRRQHSQDPQLTEQRFDEISALVAEGTLALQQADWPRLGRALSRNQSILAELGVSTSRLDAIVAEALAAGALGAKLTGAGGGGCVIALADSASAAKVRGALGAFGPIYDV